MGRSATSSTLEGLDAATVHEAYGRRGALPSAIRPVDPRFRVCGPAFTVDCPPIDNLWIHHALYEAGPGSVLVVDTRGGREAGYWGEILSVAAVARGLGGLVIDGGVRDVDRLIDIGLPIFAAGVCLRGTGKDPDADGRLGEPVVIGTTLVRTGDVVVGDRDGVVVVATEDADAVADAARERLRKEEDVMTQLRAGATTLEIYGLPQVG
ncbi:MAG TPA: RraA family protein [Solirubrobacteraceae bacterium]|nr:RraA family protein [Solirubrobacteraceae bacterium]